MVGIGNELNGDDAAGVAAVRLLRRLSAAQAPNLHLLIEAGLAPESFSGPLRRFGPDVVLFLDAAEMGEPPGTLKVMNWRAAAGFGPSTHLQPLSTLAEYLIAETGCQMAVIGVQPARLDFAAGMSSPVKAAVKRLAAGLRELLFGE